MGKIINEDQIRLKVKKLREMADNLEKAIDILVKVPERGVTREDIIQEHLRQQSLAQTEKVKQDNIDLIEELNQVLKELLEVSSNDLYLIIYEKSTLPSFKVTEAFRRRLNLLVKHNLLLMKKKGVTNYYYI